MNLRRRQFDITTVNNAVNNIAHLQLRIVSHNIDESSSPYYILQLQTKAKNQLRPWNEISPERRRRAVEVEPGLWLVTRILLGWWIKMVRLSITLSTQNLDRRPKLTSSQLVISRLLHYHYLHHIIPNAAAPIELR